MFSLKYIKKVYSLCIFLSVFSIIFASDIYSDSWAVIIGINDYNNIKGLHYAVEDAQDMKNILVEKFNFEDKNIMLLTDEDATRDNIISALYETAQKAGDNDRFIIFFAGHGTQKKLASGGDKGYLLPVEVDTSKLYLTGIDMNQIKNISEETRAKHVLYLMDACYGGLMAINSRSLDISTPGYMKKITKDKGRQIITAGGKDEEAQERTEWGNSAFTKNVIRGLDGEMANLNNDKYVTANELFTYLQEKVTIDSDNMQTPQMQRYGTGEGEFVFEITESIKEKEEKDQNLKSLVEVSTRQQYDNYNAQSIKAWMDMTRSIIRSQSSVATIYRETDIEKSSKYKDLLFGDIGFIDNESLEGKWLKLPSLSFPQFDRISGLQVGLEKGVTSSVPFTYHTDARFLYSHARKDVDYSVLVKRYLFNKKNHTLSTRYTKEVKSYDNWTVTYPSSHQSWMAFLFNIDQMDHFHSEGYTINHHYYNDVGFSSDLTLISAMQTPIEKHSDFSLVGFMADYRENYFNHDSVFNAGKLSSISMDFGFFGSTDEYRLADNRVEIKYKLSDLDLPVEYHMNYNRINFPSDTLIAEFDNNAIIYSDLHNWIDTTLLSPVSDKSGVRKFEMGNKLKSKESHNVIEYKDFPVQNDETYIFSFYVRTESDTASIEIILKDNSTGEERSNRNWHINSEWSRIWIKKTFNNKNEDEPKAWININGPISIYLWGLQLEETDIEQEEPREYVSTDGNWSSDIEVFLVPESPNWGWKSIKLLDNGDGYYTARPLLARGIYTYRLRIGDHVFIDPNVKKTSFKVNGDEVSIITAGGGPPKINIGLEYSSPEMGSDFAFTKMTYNIRHSLPLSYYETIYMRLTGGVLEGDMQPMQKQFYLGNVGTLRGYNVKEFTGNKMALINLEYHVNLIDKLFSLINYQKWWIGDLDKKHLSELEYPAGSLEVLNVDVDPVLHLKPFLFYDIGFIGDQYDENSIYHSAGAGINIYGVQLMLASRLDRKTDNWSVLFDFAGFFGRSNYLAK